MFEYQFNMSETLAIGVVLLFIGQFIKSKISLLEKYFIPAPVIGGFLFSLVTLFGYTSESFVFSFDSTLKDLLMTAFFTSVGFMASFRILLNGGISVIIFLAIAGTLAIIQNIIGISLAQVFNINPLLGIAAGSVPLTGGHGTAGAFGPVLEAAGAVGASSVAIASATYGLVAGCVIGGPIGKKLMVHYRLVGHSKEEFLRVGDGDIEAPMTEASITRSVFIIVLAMGGGIIIGKFINTFITLPIYIGPMLAAALIRNITDIQNKNLPMAEITITGNVALSIFLSIALMTMRLWDLASLAIPLIVILLTQTIFMAFFAYFITFQIMGRDYDAAVISTGHCGFGLGATPNAMANMETFTAANGLSPKAFFVIPLVGALFIDFVNALIITFFINLF